MALKKSNLSVEECLTKQTNLQNLKDLPIDILIYILAFIGDWRYCPKICEIIPMIYQHDIRYSMLHDFCCSKEDNVFRAHFSNRGNGEALRIGYNIPIKESIHLPTVYELLTLYGDQCYDYDYDYDDHDDYHDDYHYYGRRFNKDCKRYIQIQLNIYNPDSDSSKCKILSRVTKYNRYYDSSDTDIEEDEYRSFEITEYP